MIKTLNKNVRWRVDNNMIFICDCKRLIDLKLPLKYESFMKSLNKGIEKKSLSEEERLAFSDFEKMKLLLELKIKTLTEKDFMYAMNILDEELGKSRVRDSSFLHNKFKEFSQFFIGLFLDNELIGVICGFPREDYLLISEIAIDSRFQGRGFGKRLILEFERIAKDSYKKINAGAQDNVIGFYDSLGYNPFLLIQFKQGEYNLEDFSEFKILSNKKYEDSVALEIEIKEFRLEILNNLRKKYPKAYFQYIFTKELN